MDIPILTAAIILLFIAAAEIFFLFCCPKVNSFPLTIVVPVRCDDGDFESKLIYLSFLLNKNDCEIEKILLINISADNAQKAVCSRFCEEFHNVSFTDTEKIKNFFPKTIDFTENI